MTRFALLFPALVGCAFAAEPNTARFHGTVDNAVTHVMAVSPVPGDLQKVLVPTDNGAFDIDVETGRPWTLVFVDADQVGADMVKGVLRSDTLDSFLPETPDDVELGYISIDGRDATMAGSSVDLDTALGLSRHTLATIGGLDDIAVRYANPDVDGDGLLDVEQEHLARLELHLEYNLTAGDRPATPDDLVARPDQIGYAHRGTGIYGRLPDAFGPVDRDHAYLTFEQPFYGYAVGPDTPAVAPGDHVTYLTYGDSRTFGVFARPDQPVPSGNYHFQSGMRHLDFTMVRPPTQMVRHQVMPRIHFVPTVAGCTSRCAIDRIDFTWARSTEDGWVPLTDEEARALQPTGTIDVLFTDGHRHYTLPAGYASGSIPWSQELYVARTATSGDITYVDIAYQLQPGMKMYASLTTQGNTADLRHVPSFDSSSL